MAPPVRSWLSRNNPFVDWMDFEGQKLAERIYQWVVVVPSVVGFLHGYAAGRFEVTFYYWLAASLLAALLSVPSWPFLYQRNSVVWADEHDAQHKAPPLAITYAKKPGANAVAANETPSSGKQQQPLQQPKQQQQQQQQPTPSGKGSSGSSKR